MYIHHFSAYFNSPGTSISSRKYFDVKKYIYIIIYLFDSFKCEYSKFFEKYYVIKHSVEQFSKCFIGKVL